MRLARCTQAAAACRPNGGAVTLIWDLATLLREFAVHACQPQPSYGTKAITQLVQDILIMAPHTNTLRSNDDSCL
jgi:hypothetical protein